LHILLRECIVQRPEVLYVVTPNAPVASLACTRIARSKCPSCRVVHTSDTSPSADLLFRGLLEQAIFQDDDAAL
jgi:hypothetical protein